MSKPDTLVIEQAQVAQVTTKPGSALEHEYKLILVTPESSVLALGTLDKTTLFKVTVEVVE